MIGDLGGVFEILVLIFGFFVNPISEHSFTMKALEKLYLAKTKQTDLLQKPSTLKKKN